LIKQITAITAMITLATLLNGSGTPIYPINHHKSHTRSPRAAIQQMIEIKSPLLAEVAVAAKSIAVFMVPQRPPVLQGHPKHLACPTWHQLESAYHPLAFDLPV
jgi:hypothetical protein